MEQVEYKKMALIDQNYWWFLAKKNYIHQILKTLSLSRKTPKILDIGCGTGGITTFLKLFGKVSAIEQNKYACEIARKRKINVINANANKLPFTAATFDIVTCFDVLYHKKINEKKIFSEIFRVLQLNGFLIITDSADEKLWSQHDITMHARKRFSLQEMTTILEDNGFTIKHKTYIFFFLYPLIFLMRKVFFQHSANDSVIPKTPQFIEKILLTICQFEAKIATRVSLPAGSSLLIVAEKNSN